MIRFILHHGRSIGREMRSCVFPDKCLKCGIYICRDPKIHLSSCYCRDCLGKSLPIFHSPFCSCCGHVFSSRVGEDHLCEACIKKRPVLSRVRAAFEYTDRIREAVALLKYQSRLSLAKPLERHLFEAFEEWFIREPIHIILPIPLHRKKAGQRGFNQSFLLVRRFPALYRKKYGALPPWRIDLRSLVRVKHTPSQTGLDIRQRQKNLKQAFAWQSRQDLKGKTVLLVDDVYTTGSTCHAAGRTLKAAGARRVLGLVLARA